MQVTVETALYAPFLNWGKRMEWEKRIFPWTGPRKNSMSCNAKNFWIKDSRSADAALFRAVF